MLREKKIIHIGKNLFPQVENNILEFTKAVFSLTWRTISVFHFEMKKT